MRVSAAGFRGCVVLSAISLLAQQERTSDPTRGRHSNGFLDMSASQLALQHVGVGEQRTNVASILIRIENVSATILTLRESRPECDFVIEVVDSSGRPAERTEKGLRLPTTQEESRNCESVSYRSLKLEFHQSMTWTLDLPLYFLLDAEKTYSVTLRRSRGLPATDSLGNPINPMLEQTIIIRPAPMKTVRQ